MDEREFIPFSPRRVVLAQSQAPAMATQALDPPDDAHIHASDAEAMPADTQPDLPEPLPTADDSDASADTVRVAPGSPVEASQEVAAAQQDQAPQESAGPLTIPEADAHSDLRRCEHSFEIRNEAVRLAAIACGRALRHALLIDPAVIAAFVDDALAVAPGRAVHRICVHASLATHLDPARRAVQAAHGLSPGDLLIDVDGGTIGATLKTRAELLVEAAAG